MFIDVYKLVFLNPLMFMQTHTPTAHRGSMGMVERPPPPILSPGCALPYDILKSEFSTLNRSLK